MLFSRNEFIDGFTAETKGHIDSIISEATLLDSSPADKETAEKILKHIQTINITSKMMDFNTLAKLSLSLENIYREILESKLFFDKQILKLTLAVTDCMKEITEKIQVNKNDDYDIEKVTENCKNTVEGLFFGSNIYSPEKSSAGQDVNQTGIFISEGENKFFVPSEYIKKIAVNSQTPANTNLSKNTIKFNNAEIPLYPLNSILGTEKQKESAVLIVEYFEKTIAFSVENIGQYTTLTASRLPFIITGSHFIRGIVYDEKREIVPILDIPGLMQKFKTLNAYEIKKSRIKTDQSRKKILIADDSFTTRTILKSIFETDGYTVVDAEDGIEALEKLKEYHIDAIITDVNMPRMNGSILLTNIRRTKEYKTTPVIILTGADEDRKEKEFIDKGADFFLLKKNFSREILTKKVRSFLSE